MPFLVTLIDIQMLNGKSIMSAMTSALTPKKLFFKRTALIRMPQNTEKSLEITAEAQRM